MIPQETLEQITAATDIVELIGSHVSLKRAGANYMALCPFHREKSPSFNVSPSRQSFKCFGCGVGGGVFKFVQLYQNLDFPTAVRQLAERAGVAIVEEKFGGGPEEKGVFQLRRRLLALHAEAADWFHRNLMKSQDAQTARDYLKTRGLSKDVAARWRIGYAPDAWDTCLRWARERGYRDEEIVQAGLAKWRDGDDASPSPRGGAYDRFRNRLMFTISNEQGEAIAFSGRVLEADAKAAKYVNSPESPLFTKGKVLFGLHMASRALLEAKSAIVCEGQIDLITVFEAGVRNVIAPQGTAFTEQQARILKRKVEDVILCFDADAAGQQAAERSLPILLEANLGVRVVTMPAGEDPDSLIRNHGVEAFKERIAAAKDFFDFQIERLSAVFDLRTPRGKTGFSRKMAESVALLTDNVLREAVVGKVSARLGMPAADFRVLLKRKPTQGKREVDLLASDAPDKLEGEAVEDRFERPSKTIKDLLKVVLENEEVHRWLREQAWEEFLHRVAGGELLAKVLSGEFEADNPATVSAFLATFTPAEETFLTGLIMEKPFPQPMQGTQDNWRGLEKTLLNEMIATLESRQHLPDLSAEEITRLQKEVLDLKLRLQDIARL